MARFGRDRTFLAYLKRFHIRFLLMTLMFLYVIVPMLVWLKPGIVNIFIFGNYFVFPFNDLSNPSAYDLEGAHYFDLTHSRGIKLGIWQVPLCVADFLRKLHILPSSFEYDGTQTIGTEVFQKSLESGKEIILYLHGKGHNRGTKIRVGLYKALTRMGYHVITFDYRGYGDSTGHPTEDGLVADSLAVYNWIKTRCGASPILIWGHSLGTGVATKLAKQLSIEGSPPKAVILQNPFNNIVNVMDFSKSAMPYMFVPWYMSFFKKSLVASGTSFTSDVYIKQVTSPILIIHSKDDRVIPISLAYKLLEAAQSSPVRANVQTDIAVLDTAGHNNAFMDPDFPRIVRRFISSVMDENSDGDS